MQVLAVVKLYLTLNFIRNKKYNIFYFKYRSIERAL
jgi:hypothetical protein